MKRPMFNCDKRSLWLVLSFFTLMPLMVFGLMERVNQSKTDSQLPIDIDALVARVSSLNQKNQQVKSIDLLVEAVGDLPNDSLIRAMVLQNFETFLQDEISLGQLALLKDSANRKTINKVAGALELLGAESQAMETLLEGISQLPKAPDLWSKIARLELKAGREQEALDVFKEIIKLDKNNGPAFNQAALILVNQKDSSDKDLKEAEAFAGKARRLEPKNPEFLNTLADIKLRQGEPQKAEQLLEEAMKFAPETESLKEQLKKWQKNNFISE